MTNKQAAEIIDMFIASVRMTRADHHVAGQALGLLYKGAQENEENHVKVEDEPKIIPMPVKE